MKNYLCAMGSVVKFKYEKFFYDHSDRKMEKTFKKIVKNLAQAHLINIVDLIDFLLDVREKVGAFDENLRCFGILRNLKETEENWFYSASQNELIVMFDRVKDAVHNSGYLLELLFPNLNKEFFDQL